MDAAEAVYQAVMDAYEKGRREAIQECHDAVAALPQAMNCWIDRRGPHLGKAAALAAIDALRQP